MIHQAFSFIIESLNRYFSIKISEAEKVVANILVSQDGSVQSSIENKVVVSLVNVEEERIARNPDIYRKQPDGSLQIVTPEIKLNLYMLFSAYFPSDYNEALKMLSLVIGFFQKNNKFNAANSPGLNPKLHDLSVELFTLGLEQQNHLWGALGAKYLPSVVYKMRLITIADEEITGTGEPITEIQINEVKQ
ncbi:MAG: DUF4255 domain-containing protein [Bacteroidales bacterium]|nr:DUF4255 domain-containing protein [Bacteroidales bacterium]